MLVGDIYNVKAPQQLALEADGAGVFGYMKWAEAKLREEEQRALKYLETTTGKPTDHYKIQCKITFCTLIT